MKLVAESERAARLVRAAPGPDATTERLIQQPAIHQEVERIVWCVDLYRAKRLVPESRRAANRVLHFTEAGVPCGERDCVRCIAPLAQHERDAARFPWRDLNPDLQRRAWIQACAHSSTQTLAEQSRRCGQRPIPPDEVGAIARE